MPTRNFANNTVKVTTNDAGEITKVVAVNREMRKLSVLLPMENLHNEYGVDRIGADDLGRPNRFAIMDTGSYVWTPETIEAYASQLNLLAQQQKIKNMQYADANNIQPVPVPVNR